MKLLWLNWKDRKNPLAGGAEVVNEELIKRLVADGHEVILLAAGFPGAPAEEVVDGYKVIRVGNRWTVYYHAWRYYHASLKGWADLVIDEVNTIPFFAKFYVREPNILFVHMLCREIWFYQLFFPLSWIGYLAEPVYLWLLRDRKVITVSDSTKRDLLRYGFTAANITIISEGIELEPVADLDQLQKYAKPTLLSLGAIRPMKRTLDQIKAFELAKVQLPDLQLKVAGDSTGRYGQTVLRAIAESPYTKDIEYLGRVTPAKKLELMQRSHLILVASIKEGWGLIVTEAASQGTPAVVYDVDGLRDSVRHNQTGLITTENTPLALAASAAELLQDEHKYSRMRLDAWRVSQGITFEQSYDNFIRAAGV